jgi:hypothetical protein
MHDVVAQHRFSDPMDRRTFFRLTTMDRAQVLSQQADRFH